MRVFNLYLEVFQELDDVLEGCAALNLLWKPYKAIFTMLCKPYVVTVRLIFSTIKVRTHAEDKMIPFLQGAARFTGLPSFLKRRGKTRVVDIARPEPGEGEDVRRAVWHTSPRGGRAPDVLTSSGLPFLTVKPLQMHRVGRDRNLCTLRGHAFWRIDQEGLVFASLQHKESREGIPGFFAWQEGHLAYAPREKRKERSGLKWETACASYTLHSTLSTPEMLPPGIH
jgi:hypothetical protein